MLDRWAKAQFEKIYPGLLEKIAAAGVGTFLPDREPFKSVKGGKLHSFEIILRYGFQDGMMIRIHSSFRRAADDTIERYHYSHHCGPEHYDEKATYFRIDLQKSLYHVHLPPDTRLHTPLSEVAADVKDIDPRTFVDLVIEFRKNIAEGQSPESTAVPLRRKQP